MRVLLDTQVWLWMQASPAKLSEATRSLLLDVENELILSAASSWEIAIKYALGKLPLPALPGEYVPSRMKASGTTPLAIQQEHVLWTATLPHHHRDPFDRLLVAQAQIERMPLLTADSQLAAYDLELLWAVEKAERRE